MGVINLLPCMRIIELQLLASVMAVQTSSEEGLDLSDNPSQPRDINYPKSML